jgi:hypothetical protein
MGPNIRYSKDVPKKRTPVPSKAVRKRVTAVLQPSRSRYNGQGLARASVFLEMSEPSFVGQFAALFDEHIVGWTKRDMRKVSRKQERQGMLWHQRLAAKYAPPPATPGSVPPAAAMPTKAAVVPARVPGSTPKLGKPGIPGSTPKLAKPAVELPKRVKVDVDGATRSAAIEAYRAMQRAKGAITKR